MLLDFTRPWRAWPPRAHKLALLVLVFLLAGLLWAQWAALSTRFDAARLRLSALQAHNAAAALAPKDAAPAQPAPALAPDPALWPEQTDALDAWVRDAAQLAANNNSVMLQQVSVTLPEAPPVGAPPAAPYAVLKVGARGAYPALKAWQAEMQALMPSLGVESLRWQAPPNDGTGQLTAEWTWRLWVRPLGVQAAHPVSEAPTERSGWRPELLGAARDPFGLAAPPPPPSAPLTPVVEPVPVSAPLPTVAPPLQWTTVGRLLGHDGRHRVTGRWGNDNETVSLAEGDSSPEGHKVTRITTTVMELVHPETKDNLSFRLPLPPPFETR